MNELSLYSYTIANPALATPAAQVSDLPTLAQGRSTFAETLVEYAGRVCYHSTARLGSAPDFIQARLREGHEDIVEHAHLTVLWTTDRRDLSALVLVNPYLMVTEIETLSQNGDRRASYLLTGNARVWLDLFRKHEALEAVPVVYPVLPSVFGEFASPTWLRDAALPPREHFESSRWAAALTPRTMGQARVALLGLNYVYAAPMQSSATFLVEGVSRALSHQFVRHRLGSYSQASQRYVDLEKGGWEPIIPPSIAADPRALARVLRAWARLEEDYRVLRDEFKIRKEDARFLLPNATATRFVVTMPFPGWSHFLWQRAVDKAAQWEIRAVGQAILELLHEIDPLTFAKLWESWQAKAESVTVVTPVQVTAGNGVVRQL